MKRPGTGLKGQVLKNTSELGNLHLPLEMGIESQVLSSAFETDRR